MNLGRGDERIMKFMLIMACIGHIICGITDCMYEYSKNGGFDFGDIKDNMKMKHVFSAMSPRQIEIGMMLGVVALFFASFGYIAVADWMRDYGTFAAGIMKGSALFFVVLISAHHALCGATEWFYLK